MLDVGLKKQVAEVAANLKERIAGIASDLYCRPETALQEHFAAALLADFLRGEGFEVQRGLADMETAFRASWGNGGPTVAILAEMDALPVLGHACGHNIIAAAAVGAAVTLRRTLPHGSGRIVVFGTPAEETGTGKVEMIRHGCFAGVDFAMMVHPSSRRRVSKPYLGLARIRFNFFGRAAHASAYPYEGVNALDGVILTFTAINALRQQLRQDVRVHGIITEGGTAPNIIPERASCHFYVRAEDLVMLEEVKKRVVACAEGAALAAGCRLVVEEDDRVLAPFRIISSYAQLYREQLDFLGYEEDSSPADLNRGSSDIGNVSQVVPTIHPHVPIGKGVHIHTPEFARATVSEAGANATVEGAAAMALTVVELCCDHVRRAAILEEFRSGV